MKLKNQTPPTALRPRRSAELGLFAAALIAAPVWLAPALAETPGLNPEQLGVQTQGSPTRAKVLSIPIGRSAMVDLPVDASDVFVSNPKVADAVLRTPRRIFVLGTGPGTSDALFFDRMGRQILALSIHVEAATDQIGDIIKHLYPGSQVEVQALNDRIVLSGQAADVNQADQIARLAASYVKDPQDVINLLSIAGKDQVAIKVRVVEVNRTAIKQLGFSASAVMGLGTGNQWSAAQSPSYGVNQQLKGGITALRTSAKKLIGIDGDGNNIYSNTLTNGLEAFERAGLVRTLAEPNLTAVSGESAKFLAGGEFPVPVGRDNQGNVTVQFKSYGVGLGFTPVVLSDGRISLKVSSEISELTNDGALVLTGLVVPGLTVRRNENTVEMASGESIMLAGLLQSKYKQSVDSLPGLTSLPILGALFRSRDYLNEQSEMVIILTAYIVSPTAPGAQQTPADGLEIPNDLETVFLGRINKVTRPKSINTAQAGGNGAPARIAPYAAPVGYVIE
jgi:pilus assembly protein CpaC